MRFASLHRQRCDVQQSYIRTFHRALSICIHSHPLLRLLALFKSNGVTCSARVPVSVSKMPRRERPVVDRLAGVSRLFVDPMDNVVDRLVVRHRDGSVGEGFAFRVEGVPVLSHFAAVPVEAGV